MKKALLFFIFTVLIIGQTEAADTPAPIMIKVLRIDLETQQEDTSFVFKPSDFKSVTVVKHALGDNPSRRYEVRGTLIYDLSDDWNNFLNQNPKDIIRVFIGYDIVVIGYIITNPIDYVPLGFCTTKEEAIARAQRVTDNPKFLDLTREEIKKSNIAAEVESQTLKNGEKKESYVGINAPNVNTTVDAP